MTIATQALHSACPCGPDGKLGTGDRNEGRLAPYLTSYHLLFLHKFRDRGGGALLHQSLVFARSIAEIYMLLVAVQFQYGAGLLQDQTKFKYHMAYRASNSMPVEEEPYD